MRNKEKFIEDAKKVVKPEILEEVELVEDAAHCMRHSDSTVYKVPANLTITGNDESFKFELKEREATNNPNEVVEDYFYLGRGV